MGHMLAMQQRTPAQFYQLHEASDIAPRREIIEGLTAEAPFVHPKFFYDRLGSTLFDAITLTPEYYPTRTEKAIFASHLDAIVAHVGPVGAMIDLGAADCRKAESLFSALLPDQYVPVDISVDYLRVAVNRLQDSYPAMSIVALGMDFSDHLALPREVAEANRLFFYPGSSIGNLAPTEALPLLRSLKQACGDDGGVLIGIDRVKDVPTLVRAYDDSLGVTAAFNRNVLRRINDIIDSDFDVSDWRHVALFDDRRSRMEMHLEAAREVTVTWPTGTRTFTAGERLHTECSYKYTPESFTALLRSAGFNTIEHWTDDQDWFSVFSARV